MNRGLNKIAQIGLSAVLCLCLLACEVEDEQIINGYIEGDYRFIAASQSGWLQRNTPSAGHRLSVGEVVNTLDTDNQRLALQRAQQQQQQIKAERLDLQSGKRSAELDSLRAQKKALYSTLKQARTDAERYRRLLGKNAVSRIQAETAQTRVETLQAQIAAIEADIKAAELPARQAQLESADAQLSMAATAVSQAQQSLGEREIISLFEGQVVEVYAHQGEFVRTGQVLLKVLPKNARKVIFYLPQARLAEFGLGQNIVVTADKRAPQSAVVSYISDQVEFTPPIIYSEARREKLVFRLEARFREGGFPPGLPVSVAHE